MPKAPKFTPINVSKTNDLALQFDERGYQLSDEDFAKRFPNLVAGREYSIDDALGNLQGQESAVVTDTLSKSGLGDVNFGNTSFEKAKNTGATGQEILSREKRDRNYFQNLLAANPQRQFGLTGQDVAHIALGNTNSANVFNQGTYGSRVNQYNAQVQQNAANNAGYAQAGTAALGLIAKNFTQPQSSGYLSVTGYGGPYSYGGGYAANPGPATTNGPFNSGGY